MSKKIVVIGGGWAGCSAAITARRQGAEVHLYEKTDMLLGLGNVGGIFRNNGRFTAAEELRALGAGDLISIMDTYALHTDVDFPGHKHASLYDINKIEGAVRHHLEILGINLYFEERVFDIEYTTTCVSRKQIKVIKNITTSKGVVTADIFIEATGSAGPMGNCLRYGNGCSMCVLRCPAYGPRISVSALLGIKDKMGERDNGKYGAFSGSCKLEKDSLSTRLKEELEEKGVVVLSVPTEDVTFDKLSNKVCQQYALKEYAENIILLDTGHAKLMSPYYNLEKLRKIAGLENVKYADPYAGSKGNSIRYCAVTESDEFFRAKDATSTAPNLYVCGEKSGLYVGHTEAILTGAWAAYNAVMQLTNLPKLTLPASLAVGDFLIESKRALADGNMKARYTFAGGEYFNRMKEKGLYTTDVAILNARVSEAGLKDIFVIKRLSKLDA